MAPGPKSLYELHKKMQNKPTDINDNKYTKNNYSWQVATIRHNRMQRDKILPLIGRVIANVVLASFGSGELVYVLRGPFDHNPRVHSWPKLLTGSLSSSHTLYMIHMISVYKHSHIKQIRKSWSGPKYKYDFISQSWKRSAIHKRNAKRSLFSSLNWIYFQQRTVIQFQNKQDHPLSKHH